jgi:hypothetical protein
MASPRNDFAMAMRARQLSAHFTAEDLCCAGETWQRTGLWNEPQQPATWAALQQLCETILEPVAAHLGQPVLTYGFASLALFRHISGGTAKALDQHVACELNRAGQPVCPRLGAAVDFWVPSVSAIHLAKWIINNLPFDRLYFYGADRPLHVSVGPDNKRALCELIEYAPGRRRPRVRPLSWLNELEDN